MEEELYHREFVDIHDRSEGAKTSRVSPIDLNTVNGNVVGQLEWFESPFHKVPMVYADWTASGRAYRPIEEYVMNKVYPFYANTHTSTSISGLQSTCFRMEARQTIQQAVNGNTRTDVVLFTGSGATGAVNKLVGVLGLKVPLEPGTTNRPVVFVGPFEHHSNLLPWRESNADVVSIRENSEGTGLDEKHLEECLEQYKDRPLRIGAFSAASNVTGILEDVNKISALLHRHGALACWDYAAAGPYVKIDMNPVVEGEDRAFVHKDAVFISPHKFLGGVNSPGILVAKKRLFQNAVPGDTSIGGGTVYFVRNDAHRYLSNRVEREEGGTPDVVGAIRAGLAFQLKQSIGVERIQEMEQRWNEKIVDKLSKHKNIVVLGPPTFKERLPIVSFLIRHSDNLFLHYNYVSALLNDVFGIQTRGGCMCAGPYAQRLLGMSDDVIQAIENELVRDPKHCEYLRPGFTRFSLAYFLDESQVDYILDAVCLIAEHGWKLLPLYKFNTRTGEWKHKSRFTKFPGRLWLDEADLVSGCKEDFKGENPGVNYQALLKQGLETLTNGKMNWVKSLGDQTALFSETAGRLRWFVLPSEAMDQTKNGENVPVNSKMQTNDEERKVIDPYEYWKLLAQKATVSSNASSPTDAMEESPKEKDRKRPPMVCENDVCFKTRKTDKFPLRTKEVIRQDSASSSSSASLVGGNGVEIETELSPEEKQRQQVVDLIQEQAMKKATLRPKVPRTILSKVGKAMMEWDMIKEGDRLLLGLSGGKDSLCLLHVLLHFQQVSPVKFELAACTIDPVAEAFDPSPLIPYMDSLGVKYHYVKVPMFEKAKSGSLQGTSICSFCARMKRGALYACARENNYNVLVLAQHLDDLVETTFMGLFHNGNLRSMMANYEEKKGDLRVIRPLAYTREQETKEFSYQAKLPVINENCPACFEAPQERKRVKKLLAKEEATYPSIFHNMRRSIIPLMDPEVLDYIADARTTREKKGKKVIYPKKNKNKSNNGKSAN